MGIKQTKNSQLGGELINSQSLTINFVPSRVVMIIFYHWFGGQLPCPEFTSASLVCKLWRQYAFHCIHRIQIVPERLQHLLCPYKPMVLDFGLESISNLLSQSTTVQMLDLSNSEIDKYRAMIISRGLKENNSLRVLICQNCCINDDAAIEIAEGLASSSILTLDFSHNKIGPIGGLEIAKVLENNRSITNLDLSYNEIGNKGAFAIGQVFANSSTSRANSPPNSNCSTPSLSGSTGLSTPIIISHSSSNISSSSPPSPPVSHNQQPRKKKTKREIKLNLSNNHIDGEGVLALIKSRQHIAKRKTSFVYTDKIISMDGRWSLSKVGS